MELVGERSCVGVCKFSKHSADEACLASESLENLKAADGSAQAVHAVYYVVSTYYVTVRQSGVHQSLLAHCPTVEECVHRHRCKMFAVSLSLILSVGHYCM